MHACFLYVYSTRIQSVYSPCCAYRSHSCIYLLRSVACSLGVIAYYLRRWFVSCDSGYRLVLNSISWKIGRSVFEALAFSAWFLAQLQRTWPLENVRTTTHEFPLLQSCSSRTTSTFTVQIAWFFRIRDYSITTLTIRLFAPGWKFEEIRIIDYSLRHEVWIHRSLSCWFVDISKTIYISVLYCVHVHLIVGSALEGNKMGTLLIALLFSVLACAATTTDDGPGAPGKKHIHTQTHACAHTHARTHTQLEDVQLRVGGMALWCCRHSTRTAYRIN